jgi:hypothetical protein
MPRRGSGGTAGPRRRDERAVPAGQKLRLTGASGTTVRALHLHGGAPRVLRILKNSWPRAGPPRAK